MQTIIVILIVAVAAVFLVRKLLRNLKQEDTCGCGCTSCQTDTASCEDPPDNMQLC